MHISYQFLKFNEHLEALRDKITSIGKGVPRINIATDFDFTLKDEERDARLENLVHELEEKHSLCHKIYRYER